MTKKDITTSTNPIIVSEKEALEYLEWIKNKAFCNSGLHICDKLAVLFAQKLGIPCP